MAGFKPPKLVFNDIAEDADRNGQRAAELYAGGLVLLEEARAMIGLETSKEIKDELKDAKPLDPSKSKIDPNAEEKKQDMKTFFPEGSQKGIKAKQKLDPDVKSVR